MRKLSVLCETSRMKRATKFYLDYYFAEGAEAHQV